MIRTPISHQHFRAGIEAVVVVGESYGQPLRIIGLAGAEQSFQAVIRGQGEAGGVDEEFAGDVEEDEEEV